MNGVAIVKADDERWRTATVVATGKPRTGALHLLTVEPDMFLVLLVLHNLKATFEEKARECSFKSQSVSPSTLEIISEKSYPAGGLVLATPGHRRSSYPASISMHALFNGSCPQKDVV